MISGGKTAQVKVTDIMVGRKLLCEEDPKTPATSACSKQLAKTVAAAKKGLTPKQQKLWRQMVYEPTVLLARRRCMLRRWPASNPWCLKNCPPPQISYKECERRIFTGALKMRNLFNKRFSWAKRLIEGAKLIKKIPAKAPRKTPVKNRAVDEYTTQPGVKHEGGVQLPGAE